MRHIAGLLASVLLVSAAAAPTAGANAPRPSARGGDDVTVVAVIDDGITPYHWDFLASKMPQATDRDLTNELSLDRPPHEWLSGFPSPSEFTEYAPLRLTLEEKMGSVPPQTLRDRDERVWASVTPSLKAVAPYYYWLPGTKVIGAINFRGGIYGPTNSHGTGASSVVVGNLHGSCPECLLVFLDTAFNDDAERRAIAWALRQPWIDIITNSYGKNTVLGNDVATNMRLRDGIYIGETKLQRRASERGQSIFFAAHNGVERAFFVPTATLLSSEAGPDWVVTVGAVSPTDRASYTGHGKPADVSSIGSRYPSAYNSPTLDGSGNFSGTSNATPVVAGLYGRALYEVRRALPGPSRMQARGVVATGPRWDCGPKRSDCELKDGVLTAEELRLRLFHGAIHTPAGMTPGGVGAIPPIGEDEFVSEGHGTYFGLLDGPAVLEREVERIIGPIFGRRPALKRPAGEQEWMVADSFCRQHLWGGWRGGYFEDGRSEVPSAAPDWPLRSLITTACPLVPPF